MLIKLKDINILLVEDESIESMDIKRTLESFGYKVPYVASRGDEAVKKTLEIMPDLILMDIILKGDVDGIEAASKIKEHDIPIIYLTAHSEESTARRAMVTEPYGYLLKPFDKNELKFSIELALYKKKMEKEMKDSYHQLALNIPGIVYRLHIQSGQMEFFNDMVQEFTGYTPNELKKGEICSIDPLIASEDKNRIIKTVKRSIDDKKPFDVEYRIKNKSGAIKYLNERGRPVYNSLGEPEYIEGVINDITERKHAENARSGSEEKYRDLFSIIPVGISIYDMAGQVLEANKTMQEITGYNLEEYKSIKLKDTFFNIKDRSHIMRELMESGKVSDYEVELKRKNGQIYTAILNSELIEMDSQEAVLITTRDITELKMAEKALKESEAYYRTIFAYSGAATVIIEEDTIISLANPEFEKLSGYSVDEIEGKIKWTDFVLEDDLERMKSYHNQRRIDPEITPKNYEFHFLNRQGDVRDILLFVALIPGTQKSVASLLDMTEQNRANEYIKWELKVNEALNKIYAPLVSSKISIEEIANLILNQALELTDSKYGLVGEILPQTQDMILLSMIPPMPIGEPQKPLLNLKRGIYRGLMGHSLNIEKGFFTNDPVSHPSYKESDGHLQVKKFLSVPVTLKNELVGQISIANSIRDYTEHDLDAIGRLSHFYSLALQKIRDREKIRSSLDEKEILLKEIHHRVKNNMQIISSLMNLQTQYVEGEETQDILRESQGRVKSMAMIHENLYQSLSFTNIEFKDYLKKLISDIFYSYGIKKGTIKTELDIDDISLNIDTAIPLGLIINELVTNSVKYAFPKSKGTIKIKFKSSLDELELTIADDGIGLPKNIDYKKTDSLGLQLVHNLVDQIDGEITLNMSQGTEFKIIFKELEYKERF